MERTIIFLIFQAPGAFEGAMAVNFAYFFRKDVAGLRLRAE